MVFCTTHPPELCPWRSHDTKLACWHPLWEERRTWRFGNVPRLNVYAHTVQNFCHPYTHNIPTRDLSRNTMSGSEMEVEVVMAATTPPRRNLTQRRYSLQPPSPQPHAGCGLDITMPLLYDAFKPPSQREVNKWVASYKSTSVLSLSLQACSKSPSVLTLSPQDYSKSSSVLTLSPQSQSSPLPSPSGGAAADEVEQSCEYLKLREKNILEMQKKLKEMEIPASLPKKKPRRKRTKPKASDVVP